MHAQFYGHPIELEQVGTNEFLGFRINTANHSIMYIQPEQEWQFRSATSAASDSRLLTSLQSRLHIVCRGSSTKSEARKSALLLAQAYIRRDYPAKNVLRMVNQVFKRYHIARMSVTDHSQFSHNLSIGSNQ
jgi:hypothetical protein